MTTNDIEKKIKEFEEFMEGLTELDRSNFTALLSLPSAMRVANDMEEGEYKRMLIFGLALKKVGEQL